MAATCPSLPRWLGPGARLVCSSDAWAALHGARPGVSPQWRDLGGGNPIEAESPLLQGVAAQIKAVSEAMFEASNGRLKVVLHRNTDGEHFQQLFIGSATASKFLINLHAAAMQAPKS